MDRNAQIGEFVAYVINIKWRSDGKGEDDKYRKSKSRHIKKNDKDRNTVHTPVTATYTVFNTVNREHFVQIDTYGKNDREIPRKASQSIQFDKVSAKFLVDLLKKNLIYKKSKIV